MHMIPTFSSSLIICRTFDWKGAKKKKKGVHFDVSIRRNFGQDLLRIYPSRKINELISSKNAIQAPPCTPKVSQ